MLGLYVHIPFCVKKCRYCDFVSAPSGPGLREEYVDAVVCEIKRRSDRSRICDTVFIGGGTPSVLAAEQLERIASALRESFVIKEGAEFTAEANPESLSYEKAAALKSIGVNRLSIGFQSLSKRALKLLGRVHDEKQAVLAFENAGRAGFDNINIDLIFGLPGETDGEFEDTLRRVISLGPGHISAYSLIVEEGTPLEKDISDGLVPEPDETRDRNDYRLAVKMLKEAGYDRYEISNFAKPGRESKHNLRYWEQEEYLGFGPAAASYACGRRFTNTCDVGLYVEKGGDAELSEDDTLSPEETMREFMMLGFRLAEGPDFEKFKVKFGKDPDVLFAGGLASLEKRGLIWRGGGGRPFSLTEKGFDFANEVFREFV